MTSDVVTVEHKEIGKKPHSVQISISQKGKWSGEVKIYDENPDNAMKYALLKAKELEIIIKEKNCGE
ncbi:MAG: hypothetical protein Q7R52_02545 [archaeon]|nr:hypothetical protein [archaeon]